MKIILDASVIVGGDWNLAHNAAQALLAASDRGDIELLVPQVAFDEIVKAYQDQENEKLEQIKKTQGELKEMHGLRAISEESDAFLRAKPGYVQHLWQSIQHSGGRLLDFPEVPHRDLVERALDRRPPFDSKGQSGYRDALIWHNVLDVAESGEIVVFGTADSDFRERGGSNDLAHHLVKDLKDRSIDPSRVSLARSLKEIAHRVVQPAKDVIDVLRDHLADDPKNLESLVALLIEVANEEADLVDTSDVEVASEAGAFDVIEQVVDYLDHFTQLAITDAIPLANEKFGVEMWLDATAFFDITISTSGFMHNLTEIPADMFLSRDERSAQVGGSAGVRLVFEAEYERSTRALGRPRLVMMTSQADGASLSKTWRSRKALRRKRPRTVSWISLASE